MTRELSEVLYTRYVNFLFFFTQRHPRMLSSIDPIDVLCSVSSLDENRV